MSTPGASLSATGAGDPPSGGGLSVVITYPFPFSQGDGGTRMTREIARHLTRRGCRLLVMPVSTNTLDRTFPRKRLGDDQLGIPFCQALEAEGIEVVRVPQSPLQMDLDGLSVRKAMRELLRDRQVDVVVSYFREGAFLPDLLEARGVRFAVLAAMQSYHFMGKGARSPWRKLSYRLLRKPARSADVVFVHSEYSRREAQEHLGVDPGRIVLCPLGVDPSFFEVPRPERDAVRRVLYFGRLVDQKGYRDAIEAAGSLAKRGLGDWRLRMVGFGWFERARELARELGIADRLEIHEPVGDARLRQELAEADVALLPSRREAFGLAFAEAQAAGLPVVGYDNAAVPEVVEDGVTGWLAPFPGAEGLADRLEQAMRDPEGTRRAGQRARERARRLFTWERTADIILGALSRVCGR